MKVNDNSIKILSLNTLVIGTGAAGFNAADRLVQYGQKDIAIVTEGINFGTSRNTGSDKQTYYKLSLGGDTPDSVKQLAEVFFSGQCVDGDHALCEAALSAQSFLRLVELGVPFPKNRYGEYIGYKTDHDPSKRATSIGPYTSKKMTECLQASVEAKGIKIFNKWQVIKVIVGDNKVCGVLSINLNPKSTEDKYLLFNCKNLVFATGGPAGIYANSVYPVSQFGANGIAFEAGIIGKNLTEWQFGLASINPRWNVSGTYMQVLPRFVSTDKDGGDEREFLSDFFESKGDMLSKVFLKGYQWPFDVRKVTGGSSIIDILVYIETSIKDRRVFLDFRQNPKGEEIDYNSLLPEVYDYLEKAGACFGRPIERLLHMNAPAVDFYMDKGVDIREEMLEIALCAQHNNGGLSIDKWWQTNVEGVFSVGEAAASHGVYRPGGSALNAGQVGSTRAAQFIAAKSSGDPLEVEEFEKRARAQVEEYLNLSGSIMSDVQNVDEEMDKASKRMSRIGGAIRDRAGINKAIFKIKEDLENFTSLVKVNDHVSLTKAFKLKNMLTCQYVYLSAMLDYISSEGKSRGSALYSDSKGLLAYDSLPEVFRFSLDDESRKDMVQEVEFKDNSCSISWRKVREIPQEDDFFENVWRKFRENENIY